MAKYVDLFAALRPELDSVMLQVVWSEPGSCADAIAAARPFPWAVCGAGLDVDASAFAAILTKPALWFWLGSSPPWVPANVSPTARWTELLEDVRTCLRRSAGGLRLAPNRGLLSPTGALVLSPELEALVAAGDRGVALPGRVATRTARLLSAAGLGLSLERAGARSWKLREAA